MNQSDEESFSTVSVDVLFLILWKDLDETPCAKRIKRLKELSSVCKRWYEVLHRRLTQRLYGLRYFDQETWDQEVKKTRKYFSEIEKTTIPDTWFIHPPSDELPNNSVMPKEFFDEELEKEKQIRKVRKPEINSLYTDEQFKELLRRDQNTMDTLFFERNLMLRFPTNHLVELMDDPKVQIPKIYTLSSNIFELPKEEWELKAKDYEEKITQHFEFPKNYHFKDSEYNTRNPRIDVEMRQPGDYSALRQFQ